MYPDPAGLTASGTVHQLGGSCVQDDIGTRVPMRFSA